MTIVISAFSDWQKGDDRALSTGHWALGAMAEERKQTLFVLRHGDRWDDANPDWVDSRMWDPPLTERGWQRAEETGKKFRTKENVVIKRILVSPFLRCLQTCAGFLKGMYPDGDVSNVKVNDLGGNWEIPMLQRILNYVHIVHSTEWCSFWRFEKSFLVLN